MFIKLENVNKRYADKYILKDANVIINKNEKVGIIGVNGSGKSTFLNICSKNEVIDNGEIIFNTQLKISYLKQNFSYLDGITINDYIFKAIKGSGVENYEIISILNKFLIDDLEVEMTSLSGGQQRRVELALILVSRSDVLILDEPTNHLDIIMIKWLENYLNKLKKTIIVVTHDRYFLDSVTNKIIEVDRQQLYMYEGNYSYAIEHKAYREDDLIATDRKVTTKLKREKEWMMQGAKARGTKSKERTEKYYQLKEHLKFEANSNIVSENIASRLGNKTIELENIELKFGEKLVLSEFNYNFQRFDRIGIVGKNGVGKSTLLNIIAGVLKPTSGVVNVGDTVNIGYFTQNNVNLNGNLKIIDFIRDISDAIEVKDGIISASKMLERFMFLPSIQHQKIDSLSGGEKRRLFLLSLLMNKPNVLILDEPTNDFDTVTLDTLESMLLQFEGIIITVSHDRYFMSKVCDKIFEIKETNILISNMGYESYYENSQKVIKVEKVVKEKIVVKKQKTKLKMSYKEKFEFENIDNEIEEIENTIRCIDHEIIDNSANFEVMNELVQKREVFESKLNFKNERWEYLYDLDEKINGGV